jgi:hypothetical protein
VGDVNNAMWTRDPVVDVFVRRWVIDGNLVEFVVEHPRLQTYLVYLSVYQG